MPVSFESLRVGQEYSRPELAQLWGYRSYEAISRGAVTPSGTKYIILFITREKQPDFTQYEDALHGDLLRIEGESGHAADERLINAAATGDEIHLFYRDRHHQEFTYKGELFLVDYERRPGRPTRFEFSLDPATAVAVAGLETAARTTGAGLDEWIPDEEGRRMVRQDIAYERSTRNRARAIQIHGTRCKACGFDFDETYGAEHGANYIEVHHVRSITAGVSTPDPETDLIPLCSNCHSMAHRRRGMCLGLEELRTLLRR
jgi:5-methylcytosine-specific restriction protein A